MQNAATGKGINLDSLLVWIIIFLVVLAGFGENRVDSYLRSQTVKQDNASATEARVFYALQERVEAYRIAFLHRDYQTMYDLTYFKDVPRPSFYTYRNLRNPRYDYHVQVQLVDLEMNGDKGTAHLELVLEHPAIGISKSVHAQEWERLEDIWYRIDYGY
jgi:hypothetical protein